MTDEELSPEQIAAITAYMDVEAPPPDTPTVVFIFGTSPPPSGWPPTATTGGTPR
jgi:hypothetical protein